MLLKRISEGDAAAEEEFVREYQPHVRRHVRTRLRLRRIRRISDTSDICQVVLASVMVRCALGQYDIDDSGAMRRLLIRIADHKVIDLARKPEFRFPHLSISRMDEDGIEPADSKSSPTSELVLDELIAKGGQLLTDTERAIVELRRKGMSWDEVGEELAMKGDACRKRHGRAVERIVRELGLEGPRDD
jgi:RNA polymerase sigma factor (sigma-70 family)